MSQTAATAVNLSPFYDPSKPFAIITANFPLFQSTISRLRARQDEVEHVRSIDFLDSTARPILPPAYTSRARGVVVGPPAQWTHPKFADSQTITAPTRLTAAKSSSRLRMSASFASSWRSAYVLKPPHTGPNTKRRDDISPIVAALRQHNVEYDGKTNKDGLGSG